MKGVVEKEGVVMVSVAVAVVVSVGVVAHYRHVVLSSWQILQHVQIL
jgi:predicted component of type VI protein secretion system